MSHAKERLIKRHLTRDVAGIAKAIVNGQARELIDTKENQDENVKPFYLSIKGRPIIALFNPTNGCVVTVLPIKASSRFIAGKNKRFIYKDAENIVGVNNAILKVAIKAKKDLAMLHTRLFEADMLGSIDADRLICACNDVDAIIIELEATNETST